MGLLGGKAADVYSKVPHRTLDLGPVPRHTCFLIMAIYFLCSGHMGVKAILRKAWSLLHLELFTKECQDDLRTFTALGIDIADNLFKALDSPSLVAEDWGATTPLDEEALPGHTLVPGTSSLPLSQNTETQLCTSGILRLTPRKRGCKAMGPTQHLLDVMLFGVLGLRPTIYRNKPPDACEASKRPSTIQTADDVSNLAKSPS